MPLDATVQSTRDALRAWLAGIVGDAPIARFDEALTHPSYANETNAPDNQRLEFLGDAVLGLCVSELLAAAYADADEGKLTRMRSAIVNAEALATWARKIDLGATLALGRGARAGSERDQTNVLADAVEALVAAVYEARGIDGARALVRVIVSEIGDGASAMPDPKSLLQERVQARGMQTPSYRVAGTRGPQHEQVFEVDVLVGEDVVGRGEGRSKRAAERAAAAEALRHFDDGDGDGSDDAGAT